jgi:hypothetical protein
MGETEEQGRDFSCRQDAFRVGCLWQPQPSQQRDFLPLMIPVRVCPAALFTKSKGGGKDMPKTPLGSWA